MIDVKRVKSIVWEKLGLPKDPDEDKGYVGDVQQNLLPGVTTAMIEQDYHSGNGQEWMRKIRAIHSSSALAANTFGRWKSDPGELTFCGMSGFTTLRLEAKCPTGLRGAPPNLDVLLESPEMIVGIESKFLEPLKPTLPGFSASYSPDRLPLCEAAWMSLLEKVRQQGLRKEKSYLDTAQLIKHYLGRRHSYQGSGKKIRLVYLYWRPVNSESFEEYQQLKEELRHFKGAVQNAEGIEFMALDYLELWNSWETDKAMAEHARLLNKRYRLEI